MWNNCAENSNFTSNCEENGLGLYETLHELDDDFSI